MHAKMIEETLGKIISIDNKTILIEKEAISIEKEKYKQLKKDKKDLEFALMKEGRKEAKIKYDEIVGAARVEAAEIEASGLAECERLKGLLDENKEEMVEKVFMRLFEAVFSQLKNLE